MKTRIIVLALFLCCIKQSFAFACEAEYKGKSLFSQINSANNDTVVLIESELKLQIFKSQVDNVSEAVVSYFSFGMPINLFVLEGEKICIYKMDTQESGRQTVNISKIFGTQDHFEIIEMLQKKSALSDTEIDLTLASITKLKNKVFKQSLSEQMLFHLFQFGNNQAIEKIIESIKINTSDLRYSYSILLLNIRIAMLNYDVNKVLTEIQSFLALNNQLSNSQNFKLKLEKVKAYLRVRETHRAGLLLKELDGEVRNKKIKKNLVADFFNVKAHLYLNKHTDTEADDSSMLHKSIEFQTRALEVAYQIDLQDEVIRIHNNLAWLYKTNGDITSSIRNYLIALYYVQAIPDHPLNNFIYRNLGQIYHSIGDFERSLMYLQIAESHAQKNFPFWKARIKCIKASANASLGATKLAENEFMRCIDLLEELVKKETNEQYLSSLLEAYLDYDSLLGTKRFNLHVEKVLSELQYQIQEPNVAAKYYVSKVLEGEQSYMQSAVQSSIKASDPYTRISVAISLLINKHLDTQSVFYQQTLELVFAALKQINEQSFSFSLKKKLSNFIYFVYDDLIEQENYELLFSTHNRFKNTFSSVLKDADSLDDRLWNDLTEISTLTSNSVADKSPSLLFKKILKQDLTTLLKTANYEELTQLEISTFKLKKTNSEQYTDDKSVTISNTQSILKQGDIFISYIGSKDDYYAFTINKNNYSFTKIGAKLKIDPLIKSLYYTISTPSKKYQALIKQYSPYLLPEAKDNFEQSQIYIQTSGMFDYVPFVSLVQNGNTLIQNGNTITLIKNLLNHDNESDNSRYYNTEIAIFADPVFYENKQDWRSRLPRLPWSKYEAENIANLFNNQNIILYLQSSATRQNLLSSSSRNAKYLHVSSHSFYDPERPSNVGFTLSIQDVNGLFDSGYVTVNDLNTLPFNNHLVVLNGCESALGDKSEIDGFLSMSSAFLQAGAENVLGSSWPVSDKASTLFFIEFYKQIKRGLKPSVALKNTQLIFSKHSRYRHPFYWSGFTLQRAKL